MADSYEVLQDSKLLIKELREGVEETKKTSDDLVRMLQNSSVLFNEMTGAVEETKDTPKEFVNLLKEISLLAGEIKDTVSEAKKSQITLTQSASNARDILAVDQSKQPIKGKELQFWLDTDLPYDTIVIVRVSRPYWIIPRPFALSLRKVDSARPVIS